MIQLFLKMSLLIFQFQGVLEMCLNYNTWTKRSISIIGRALLVSHNSSDVVPKKPQEKAIELFNLAVQKQYTFLISSLFSSLDFFSLFLRQAKGSISLKHPLEGRRRRRRRNQPTLHHTQSTIVENCGRGKKKSKRVSKSTVNSLGSGSRTEGNSRGGPTVFVWPQKQSATSEPGGNRRTHGFLGYLRPR